MFELWGCRRWWHLVHLVWAVAVKVWIGSHVCCECLPTTMLVWWVCAESQTQRALLIRILLTSTVTSVQQSAHHPSGVVSHRARSLTRGGGEPFGSRVSILVHCRDIIILGLKLCTHVATEKPDMHTHQFIDLLDWQSCAGIGGWQVLAFFCPSGQKSGNVSAGSGTLADSPVPFSK